MDYWEKCKYGIKFDKEIGIKPRIVCLCGSVRFEKEFKECAEAFHLSGDIVLMPVIFRHDEFHDSNTYMQSVKRDMDRVHKWKILMAELIFIIDKDGYIGESTQSEIEFAKSRGKWIAYMSEEGEMKKHEPR